MGGGGREGQVCKALGLNTSLLTPLQKKISLQKLPSANLHFEEMAYGVFQPYLTWLIHHSTSLQPRVCRESSASTHAWHITGAQYIPVKFQNDPLSIEFKLSMVFFALDLLVEINMQIESETQSRCF